MKRSGQVGLVVMGAAAFAATYASVAAYRAGTQTSITAAPQQAAAAPAQNCTPRPDGTQNCQPAQRGFAYYLLPSFMYGSSSASAASARAPSPQSAAFAGNPAAPAPKPQPVALTNNAPALAPAPGPKAQSAALTNKARISTPTVSASGTTRNGFGTTAQSNSYRVSAGG